MSTENNGHFEGMIVKEDPRSLSEKMAVTTISVRRHFSEKDGTYEKDYFEVLALGERNKKIMMEMKRGDIISITGSVHINKRNYTDKLGKEQNITDVQIRADDLRKIKEFVAKDGEEAPAPRPTGRPVRPIVEEADPFSDE